MAGDGRVKPLIRDCRAVRVPCRHQGEFEERSGPSVEHLNIYRVDFLELSCQNGVIVRVQNLAEGKDEITPKCEGDVRGLKSGER